MTRTKIIFSRIESLTVLEGLSLFTAKMYREMQSIEEIVSDTSVDGSIKKQIELKKIDNALKLMQLASIEKRFVTGFMQNNAVELGENEIKIIISGLERIPKAALALTVKLNKYKNYLKHKEENEMPVIYETSVV